jgi:hypothetical protein
MRYILIALALGLALMSCDETECCANPDGDITMVGTWKLSKLCFSNGASSCNSEDLWDADYEETITFTTGGEYRIDNEGVICAGDYEREGELNVNLTARSGDCNFKETTRLITKLTETEMIFSPRCIEGCPYLYVRQ